MKDIVIVLAFDRVPFVETCLNHLSKCHGIDEHEVWLSEDIHAGEHSYVIPVFKNLQHTKRTGVYSSRENWIATMREAHETDAAMVHIFDDDMVAAPDYLQWAQLAHKTFDPYVSCGVNIWTKPLGDARAVGVSNSDFASWAICMRRENLLESIKRTDRHPEETIHNRVIYDRKLVVFPSQPRAYNTQRTLGVFGEFGDSADNLYVGEDRRDKWQADYDAQAKWGF